jgi:outer membrane protein, heavy metal efflux system
MTPSIAQERVITISDALQIAMQNNPELNRIEEQIQIQKTYTGLAWGIDSPELFYMKEGMDGHSFMEKRWGISQTLSFPLTGYYQDRTAKSEIEIAELQFEAARREIRAAVKEAYTELAYSLKQIELVNSELNLARELQEIAQIRLEVGESSELDLIQSEIQSYRAQNDLRLAEEMKDKARYALFRVIGLDPEDQQYGITFPDTLSFIDTDIVQQQVMKSLELNPEIRLVELKTESARRNIRTAKSSYLPDLRINYYRQDYGGGFEFNGFEIGVSIPVWFGFNERNKVKRAHAEARQAEWSEIESILRVKEKAENAWHSYETSRESIRIHRDFIQSRTSILLSLTQEGYRAGEMDLLRVLEAQRVYLEGIRQYYQALRNYYLQLIALELFLPNEIVFTE